MLIDNLALLLFQFDIYRGSSTSIIKIILTHCFALSVFTTAVPVINRHPNGNGNITVTDGANLRLRCEATGNGTLTYQWRRVSGSFPDSTEVRNNGQILFIGSITITDGGQYYCVVSDNDGSVSSMRVLVTVNRKLINH